jgi:hypothetical protein
VGVGSIHGKNQESRVAADRGSVLSGNAHTGPSHVGSATGLKAKISVLTNSPARGDWVTLSAEHSGPHVKEYEWSFAYADEPTNGTDAGLDLFKRDSPAVALYCFPPQRLL